MNPGTRSRIRNVAIAVLFLVTAVCAFVLRFNALGGALGGLDDEDFHNTLSRVDLILVGEQPLRDFADPDLRGAWPALTYEVPALVQRWWGETLLPYAVLTCLVLALCAVAVLCVARGISRSWLLSALAAAAVVTSAPKLYNYPKVLSLAGAAAAIWWVVQRPTKTRLTVLALWTVVAGLYRHDFGLYVGVASAAGLVASDPGLLRASLRRVGIYGAMTLVFSLPSAVWVAYYVGIPRYVSDSLVAVEAEGRRLRAWPAFDLADLLSESNLISFNYYAFWAVPALILVALCVHAMGRTTRPRRVLAAGVALCAMAALANAFFLRSNLPARFGDAVVPVALGVVWLAGAAGEGASRSLTLFTHTLMAMLLMTMCAAFVHINSVVREMATGGLTESVSAATRRFGDVIDALRQEPPGSWTGRAAEKKLAAARYLAECTSADDRVLMAALADEVSYFARRHMAGGQRRFNGVLTSDADQRLVLERMARQSVPVVIMEPDYEEVMAPDYPLVVDHLKRYYREAGVVSDGATPLLRVWVEKARLPVRIDAVLGFPCFQ